MEVTLTRLATSRGLSLTTPTLTAAAGGAEQVAALGGGGLVVGLHGANLVNAAWEPAAAALVEVFPQNYAVWGYYVGKNAGLWYAAVEGSPVPSRLPPAI